MKIEDEDDDGDGDDDDNEDEDEDEAKDTVGKKVEATNQRAAASSCLLPSAVT